MPGTLKAASCFLDRSADGRPFWARRGLSRSTHVAYAKDMAMNQTTNGKEFELDYLLHRAGAFRTPMDVVNDPDMTVQEKRATLASWASDACAVEAAPDWRRPPTAAVVRFD